MKRIAALLLIFLIMLPVAGCGSDIDTRNSTDTSPGASPAVCEDTAVQRPTAETDNNGPAATDAPGKKRVINAYCCTMEEYKIMERYRELHPELSFEIHLLDTIDISYYGALNDALEAGGKDMPDIYTVDSEYVKVYTRGKMAKYAAPYKDLGIDVDTLLKEADIYQYVVAQTPMASWSP